MNRVYCDSSLIHPLSEEEYAEIDDVWRFIKCMRMRGSVLSDIRKSVISRVRKQFTVEQAARLEKTAEKMLWNIRTAVYPTFAETKDRCKGPVKKDIPDSFLKIRKIQIDEECIGDVIDRLIAGSGYRYRSFINKQFVFDKNNRSLISRDIESSSEIMGRTVFNTVIGSLFFNRYLYEQTMEDPYSFDPSSVKQPEFFYEFDYPFATLNLSVFVDRSDREREERTRQRYFSSDPERYWFRFIP